MDRKAFRLCIALRSFAECRHLAGLCRHSRVVFQATTVQSGQDDEQVKRRRTDEVVDSVNEAAAAAEVAHPASVNDGRNSIF